MKSQVLDQLMSLRKTRVDNAIRDIQALRAEERKARQKLAAARSRFAALHGQHDTLIAGMASMAGRSLSDVAAIQGNVDALREQMRLTIEESQRIEAEIRDLEKRIVEARDRWRQMERARDRCQELADEMKKRELFAALAAEELSSQ